MKKRFFRLTALLVSVSLLFTACYDQKDFDFGKFDKSSISPTLYIPLLSDTLDILDAGLDDLLFTEDGQAYYEYAIDDIQMPSILDMVVMPPQTVSETFTSPIPPSSGGSFSTPEVTDVANFNFNNADGLSVSPDSIVFNSLQLQVANLYSVALVSGDVFIRVTIPNLRNSSGGIYSTDISIKNTTPRNIDLSGYSLKVDHPSGGTNQIKIKYQLYSPGYSSLGSPSQNLGFSVRFVPPATSAIREAYGYLGQYTEHVNESIEIGDFDKLAGTWNLKEAFIVLDVVNPLVLPMQVSIDQVTAYSTGSTVTVPNAGTATIRAATSLSAPPAETSATLGGVNLSPVISALPKRMDVAISVKTNPAGSMTNAIDNAPLYAAAKVVVPFKIKKTTITLTDTIDFNMEDISLSDMGINLHVVNAFPMAVKLHCDLLEKGTGRNLGQLFTPVQIPTATVKAKPGTTDEAIVDQPTEYDNGGQLIPITETMAQNMKKSDRVKVYFEINVPDGKYVCITDQNNIRFKIAMKAAVNINGLNL